MRAYFPNFSWQLQDAVERSCVGRHGNLRHYIRQPGADDAAAARPVGRRQVGVHLHLILLAHDCRPAQPATATASNAKMEGSGTAPTAIGVLGEVS